MSGGTYVLVVIPQGMRPVALISSKTIGGCLILISLPIVEFAFICEAPAFFVIILVSLVSNGATFTLVCYRLMTIAFMLLLLIWIAVASAISFIGCLQHLICLTILLGFHKLRVLLLNCICKSSRRHVRLVSCQCHLVALTGGHGYGTLQLRRVYDLTAVVHAVDGT